MNKESIFKIIKDHSLRLTNSRIALVDILLKNSDDYLTPEELFIKITKAKNLSSDQVSVYRNLTKFEELGIVKKSEFHHDASRYILNKLTHGKPKRKHEHYFKCFKCDTIEPFSDCFISKKEKELKSSGYSQLSHHLEITGLCPSCS